MSTQPWVCETQTQSLYFDPLDLDGLNFLEWSIDVKTYVYAEELETALDRTTAPNLPLECRWQTLLLLRRHLAVPTVRAGRYSGGTMELVGSQV